MALHLRFSRWNTLKRLGQGWDQHLSFTHWFRRSSHGEIWKYGVTQIPLTREFTFITPLGSSQLQLASKISQTMVDSKFSLFLVFSLYWYRPRKRTHIFRVIGQFVAKAMLDSRIIDLSFNKIFVKLVLGEEVPVTIATLKVIHFNTPYFSCIIIPLNSSLTSTWPILSPNCKALHLRKITRMTKFTLKISNFILPFLVTTWSCEYVLANFTRGSI